MSLCVMFKCAVDACKLSHVPIEDEMAVGKALDDTSPGMLTVGLRSALEDIGRKVLEWLAPAWIEIPMSIVP